MPDKGTQSPRLYSEQIYRDMDWTLKPIYRVHLFITIICIFIAYS